MIVNTEQKTAYEWAKNQNYTSVAARYARLLTGVIDEKNVEIERLKSIYEPICPKCGLKNQRLVINRHCDRCGESMPILDVPEKGAEP